MEAGPGRKLWQGCAQRTAGVPSNDSRASPSPSPLPFQTRTSLPSGSRCSDSVPRSMPRMPPVMYSAAASAPAGYCEAKAQNVHAISEQLLQGSNP